jgi:MarR family transcriptional regulator, lower aerobic nicotinate degradation pathway regulator
MTSEQAPQENTESSAAETGMRRKATVSRSADDEKPIPRDRALAAYEASGYDLPTHPAHLIRRAHQRATFYFQQVMNGLDLTPTQQAALATLLKRGELSQNHLGRLTAMDPSTISIVVRKLLKTGLIKRRGSKKDQRLAMIRLTDQGTRFAIGRLADSMEVARRVLAPLSPAEQKTLIDLLHRIGDGDDDFA